MTDKITSAINIFGKYNIHEKLCVSLSGGVDSMVLLYCLKMYQTKTEHYKSIVNFNLCAVHINYNNRPTCDEEVKFVQEFCDYLKVDLEIRNITELKREKNNSRNKYEELTRNIRFDLYKTQNCPILLAHNYEDSVENLIANIASKRKYYNLKGMTENCTEKDVCVLRPFLKVSKKHIYEYANKYNITHLPDSTPKWSRRGKLRDHIIPTLEAYEPNLIKGLEEISSILAELKSFKLAHQEH